MQLTAFPAQLPAGSPRAPLTHPTPQLGCSCLPPHSTALVGAAGSFPSVHLGTCWLPQKGGVCVCVSMCDVCANVTAGA